MAKRKIYRFKGTEGGSMSTDVAKKWIQAHQDHHQVKGHFFGKETLTKLLNQPGCMGIRIYHAIDESSSKKLILVGADAKGDDMWSPPVSKGKFKAADEPGGGAVDQSWICPPYCSSK